MTCIVGLVHEDEVYIGGDSASVGGWVVHETSLPKVFRRGEFIIGYTTSFRMGQILQYNLKIPQKNGGSDQKFMVTVFAEAVRECLKDYGFAETKDNTESGGQFLVAFNQQLYYIGSDYQVNSYKEGYTAIGAGVEIALGALYAPTILTNPRERVKMALSAAAHHSIMVVPPFKILVQKSG